MKENFEITSVSRADLEHLGFDTTNVTDEDMETIASKMEDAYLDDCFWIDLKIIAGEYMDIPRKETEN